MMEVFKPLVSNNCRPFRVWENQSFPHGSKQPCICFVPEFSLHPALLQRLIWSLLWVRRPMVQWGMSKDKTVFVLKLLWSVERQTQDLTISLKVRCTVMLFGHRTILQSNKLPRNQTQREILSPLGRQAGWEHLLVLEGVTLGEHHMTGRCLSRRGKAWGQEALPRWQLTDWAGLSPTDTQALYLPSANSASA